MTARGELEARPADVLLYALMQRYGDLAISAVIDLRRSFEAADLERAFAATLADFPVLGCRYRPGFTKDRWLPVVAPLSEAVICETSADWEGRADHWLRVPVVPERDRQLRVVALEHEGRTRLIVTVMHLAVDGAGVAAVGHVFGAHLYGLPPALPIDRRRGLRQSLDGLGPAALLGAPGGLVRALVAAAALVTARPRARDFTADAGAPASWRHVTLSAASIARVHARLGRKASMNDVLVAALSRAVARRLEGGRPLVFYTMDLRRYGSAARFVAANVSSVLVARLPASALGSLEEAVKALSPRSARQRRGLDGPSMLLAPLALARLLPHGLARAIYLAAAPEILEVPMRRGVLITNVGRIDRGLAAFDADLEQIRIVGPNVRNLGAPLIVAYGHRGALHLSIYGSPGLGALANAELEADLCEALGVDDVGAVRETTP